MARAEAASASARSDSIKGLAQSIAKPAYRRLLTAEPALRRAVPVLIIAFLLTICVGAVVQVLEHRRQVGVEAVPTAALEGPNAFAVAVGRNGDHAAPRMSLGQLAKFHSGGVRIGQIDRRHNCVLGR